MKDSKIIIKKQKLKFWVLRTKILNHFIPFYLDGFYNNEITGYSLSNRNIDCNDWFIEFKKNISSNISKKYLPICRLSDGEYTFICGSQPPLKYNFIAHYFSNIKFFINKLISNGNLNATTTKGVSSGNYLKNEIDQQKSIYLENLKDISNNGILAMHLTYAEKPFQERFHYSISKIFKKNQIILNEANYFPFYFVYAYLQTVEFFESIKNKNVLMITGANDDKINIVNKYLIDKEINFVRFYKISANRSLYDKINLADVLLVNYDICFVAAGIGKPNILVQLRPLNCPCIDIGFMFEVWAKPEQAYNRPWCSKNYKTS
jgi:hypothetical protein